MSEIVHNRQSHDSLFLDIEKNLEILFLQFNTGAVVLKPTIAILSAVKLEAFINISGLITFKEKWDDSERLPFVKKCNLIFEKNNVVFDPDFPINKSAAEIFDVRNSLVHPKMEFKEIDESISYAEYEAMQSMYTSFTHPLREILTDEKIVSIKETSDNFITLWKPHILGSNPNWWLASCSQFSYTKK